MELAGEGTLHSGPTGEHLVLADEQTNVDETNRDYAYLMKSKHRDYLLIRFIAIRIEYVTTRYLCLDRFQLSLLLGLLRSLLFLSCECLLEH